MNSIKIVLLFVFIRVGAVSFDNYEEVTQPPLESLQAIQKCGDGLDKNVYKCVMYYDCDSKNQKDAPCGHFLEVCCKMQTQTVREFQSKCGIDNIKPNEDFPWVVALFNKKTMISNCGGSLLTPTVVLTAAHCLQNLQPDDLFIRVGNLLTSDQNLYQDRNVSKIIIHEDFNNTLHNNIAILILSDPLSDSDNIATICIPPVLDQINRRTCLGTGFNQNDPEKVQYALISKRKCQSVLRQIITEGFDLDKSSICAMGSSETLNLKSIPGDSLVCQDTKQRYFQIGIVSNVDYGTMPTVYTNVAMFRQWIDGKLSEIGYNSSNYVAL